MRIFFFILLSIIYTHSYSQNFKISGVVTDKSNGKPIPGVIITIQSQTNNIIKYTKSSDLGYFSFVLDNFSENNILQFSMLGFSSQTFPLLKSQHEYRVKLIEKSFQLREVVAKAQNIRREGDTITYQVSRYAAIQDKTLADVLRHMPGIEVSDNGEIKYNGVSINKFYIEGKDMLGGHYGIATNNIHQQDVGSIQVLENHQPVKALKDLVFSSNPAINVRLKENAQNRWAGTINAGIGTDPMGKPDLWNGTITAMRFKEKSQTLDTYKTNNTGNDVSGETKSLLTDHTNSILSNNYNLNNYISASPEKLSQINSKRSCFNKTHLLSLNNLLSLSKDYEITSLVDYTNDQITTKKITESSYYLDDSTYVTNYNETASDKKNNLSGTIHLKANTDKFYLDNKLQIKFNWNQIHTNTTGTSVNLQKAQQPNQNITYDFQMIKRSKNTIFVLNSYNSYEKNHEKLRVDNENSEQIQSVHSSAYFTNTNTSLSRYFKPFNFSLKIGIKGLIHSLKSNLSGIDDTIGIKANYFKLSSLNLFIAPELEFNKGSLHTSISAPAAFIPSIFNNIEQSQKNNITKFFVLPEIRFNLELTGNLSLSAVAGLTSDMIQDKYLHNGWILNNYNNLTKGIISFSTNKKETLGLTLAYRNELKSLFWNFTVSNNWNYNPVVTNREVQPDYILTTYINRRNYSKTLNYIGSASKGIDIIKGIVSITGAYSNFEGSGYQNSLKYLYNSKKWSVLPKLSGCLFTHFNLSYSVLYNQTKVNNETLNIQNSYKKLVQKLECNLTIKKSLMIRLNEDYFYNHLSEDVNTHLFMSDVELAYTFLNDFEFNLTLNNLFNKERYEYTSNDGLSTIYHSYQIRPFNLILSLFFRF